MNTMNTPIDFIPQATTQDQSTQTSDSHDDPNEMTASGYGDDRFSYLQSQRQINGNKNKSSNTEIDDSYIRTTQRYQLQSHSSDQVDENNPDTIDVKIQKPQLVHRGTNPPETMLQQTIIKIDRYLKELDQRPGPSIVQLQVDQDEFPQFSNCKIYCVDCSDLPGGIHKAYLEKASLFSARSLLHEQLEKLESLSYRDPERVLHSQIRRSIVTSGNQGPLEQKFVNNINEKLSPEDEFLMPIKLAILEQPDNETSQVLKELVEELGAWYKFFNKDLHDCPHPKNPNWIDVLKFTENKGGKEDGHYQGNPYQPLAETIFNELNSIGVSPDAIITPYGTGALLHGIMCGLEGKYDQSTKNILYVGGASSTEKANKIFGDHLHQENEFKEMVKKSRSASTDSDIFDMDEKSGEKMSNLFAKNSIKHEYSSAVGCSAAFKAVDIIRSRCHDAKPTVMVIVNTGMGMVEQRIKARHQVHLQTDRVEVTNRDATLHGSPMARYPVQRDKTVLSR